MQAWCRLHKQGMKEKQILNHAVDLLLCLQDRKAFCTKASDSPLSWQGPSWCPAQELPWNLHVLFWPEDLPGLEETQPMFLGSVPYTYTSLASIFSHQCIYKGFAVCIAGWLGGIWVDLMWIRLQAATSQSHDSLGWWGRCSSPPIHLLTFWRQLFLRSVEAQPSRGGSVLLLSWASPLPNRFLAQQQSIRLTCRVGNMAWIFINAWHIVQDFVHAKLAHQCS